MATSTSNDAAQSPTLFGHPTGLYALFFAEMWERFSYYGMRALLVFYMIKGFLGYNDGRAYGVYGAYCALVYATPFIGGMIADRWLGTRRGVVLGGLLMAAGHLLMMAEHETAFFVALALLICGNGFFKPNISTIVGGLYPQGSDKKDAGFTIFYMGINLGAAMAPILCGYIGETYGWHYGFGLATVGMLIGVAIFVAPTRLCQAMILFGALGTSIAMPFFQDSPLQLAVRCVLALALTVSGIIAIVALERGGIPDAAGRPRDPKAMRRKLFGILRYDVAMYLGILVSIPIFASLVRGDDIAGYALLCAGALALGYILYEVAFRFNKVERERMFVVLILMFFSMLFWAFFEQAGSSVNNFTDRNVDRVFETHQVIAEETGTTLELRVPRQADEESLGQLPRLTQEQLGHDYDGKKFSLTHLTDLRKAAGEKMATDEAKTVSWPVATGHVGMGVGGAEIPASEFQAANPIFILIFGLVFTGLWRFLSTRGLEPSTPVKFSMGILQLGLGFGILWYGTQVADSRGMVGLEWLLIAYLLQTTGELCLSPVGLAMVTKLSPTRLIATIMGAWFLSMAFSNYLASLIARFTDVSDKASNGVIPPPVDTVHVYGAVFGKIAIAAIVSAAICFVLSPLLNRWMHHEVVDDATLETNA